MSALTKEQIDRLTPEQQKDLAAVELRRIQKRQRLLKQARQSQLRIFIQAAGFFVILGIACNKGFPLPLIFCIAGLAVLTLSEIFFANRRIDALFELYEDKEDDNAV